LAKVLIVDDEPMVRRLLREVLSGGEFEIVEAADVESAERAAALSSPEVALVDKNLPDGSGLDLIRSLKNSHPGLQAILITAYPSMESAIEATRVGAFDYLVKPFEQLHGLPLKVTNAAEKARLHRLEAQMRHAQKMEALGLLAGGVAHDFNNLLCVILNCGTETLDDVVAGTTNSGTVDALRDILHAVDNATRLTRQLLSFSRHTSAEADILPLDLVISETETLLRRVLGEELQLVLTLDAGLSHVKVARSHLEQVLINLVINARDAMPPNGIIRIETHSMPGSVSLTIADTGCGMAPEVSARIFEPFFTTKDSRGTGLGLAMVRSIVLEAGGKIAVQSVVGQGTLFSIVLPRAEAALAKPGRGPVTLPAGRGDSVLIVEDDEAVLEVVERMFARAGYRVTAARSAAEAILQFELLGGAVDLLVTDVVMPQLSGPDLSNRLRALQPSLKTVFLSGHVDTMLEQHGVDGASQALVLKPFGEHELARVVARVRGGLAA